MGNKNNSFAVRLLSGVALAAVASIPGVAAAQDASDGASATGEDVIVVRGIRGSLQQSMEIKRNAQGVVDAISAEDIGKFPDTNLAESLQRITGVSIDRANGEGSTVTVRGWGPEYNLVTLNGRQMPTTSLGDGASAPSSRSFDFANLASENIAGVDVYKTSRASVPSGGIGSTINIRTSRPFDNPGMRGAFSVKAVVDESRNDDPTPTPEISGLFSDTFANDTVGILISGSYQKREGSVNTASVGWREGFTGAENAWGTIPNAGTPGGDPPNVINHPGPTDVYSTPQNASYSLTDINRERYNGQVVLQWRPIDSITATVDYTYSQNTVQARENDVGIWFNLANSTSAWGDGPVSEPLSYSEVFGGATGDGLAGKDLSHSGSLTENRSTNNSTGFNLRWDATDRLTLFADYHNSSAESGPNNPYGTSISVGTAVFGLDSQGIDFTHDLPILFFQYHPGLPLEDASYRLATGNAFRTAYQRDEIEEYQLHGSYAPDWSIVESLDFGVDHIENNVRSAFGVIQNDTWGGANPNTAAGIAEMPDNFFHWVTIPDKFDGISGAGDPRMIQGFYSWNFEQMVGFIDSHYNVCGGDGNCIAPFTTDRRIQEETNAAYLQAHAKFEVGPLPANLIAGVRYEKTEISSSALVPVPQHRTAWVAANEFNVFNQPGVSSFTTLDGEYDYWLPSVDFDVDLRDDLKLRLSASRSLTRPTYNNMQGGVTIDQLFRIGQGTASAGNPGLLPNISTNYDISLEWYYAPDSYAAIGYFRKDVENFISTQQTHTTLFDLRHPGNGPRAQEAIAAVGNDPVAIRNYLIANYPQDVEVVNGVTRIYSVDADPLIDFLLTQPANSDQKATVDGWEFALQHNFGDTGFGVVANYTLVQGDLQFDNTQPHTVSQFALTGLSDSANLIGFYDKNGIQARIAYNWRDEFYAGGATDPNYVEAYGQVDLSASYDVAEHLTLFLEGINVTGEGRRGHRRSENEVTFVTPGDARWAGGLRYSF
ncbi:MAG TPA: TonB-dependent receptor [Caulobacterales bacterium]|nr:TonB-dependent receptor [Caulobacterales bacterium]